jgi:hypothetical protein
MTPSAHYEVDSMSRHISPELLSQSHYQSQTQDAFYVSRSASSSPPAFAYSYPPPDQVQYAAYPQHMSHYGMPVTGAEMAYLPPMPTTLPTMSSSMRSESLYAEEDQMTPFGLSFAVMAGMDAPASYSASEMQNAHVIPTRHFSQDSADSFGSLYSTSDSYDTLPASVSESQFPSLSYDASSQNFYGQ